MAVTATVAAVASYAAPAQIGFVKVPNNFFPNLFLSRARVGPAPGGRADPSAGLTRPQGIALGKDGYLTIHHLSSTNHNPHHENHFSDGNGWSGGVRLIKGACQNVLALYSSFVKMCYTSKNSQVTEELCLQKSPQVNSCTNVPAKIDWLYTAHLSKCAIQAKTHKSQ